MNQSNIENKNPDIVNEDSQKFRNKLATVTEEGKRRWIFPRKPFGRFYNARTIVSIFLLAFLFGSPFIKINGQQFLLLNFPERNFILFGIPFGPHDFHIFVIAMITIIVFIILFTAVFGRVFCGWACPQTIFMEMVFRKIEYWIEGDAKEQRKLKAAPWSKEKFFKKGLKHSIFFGIAFVISNFFLAYIIGMDNLIVIITDPPSEHIKGFLAILAFSGVFYWIFSYFREQVCTIVCPYGRLQGVLLDQDSVVIAYDYKRGEPRKKIRKNENQNDAGDCIDCNLCVEVCPTGIDIRDGIQLECVNCTACIDACDYVMDKVKRPRGLIRYDSLNGIESGKKFRLTPRAIFYTVLLVLLLGVLSYLMATRTDFNINILRTPGLLYQDQPGDKVSNLYDLNIVNKTYDSTPITLKLENIEGEIKMIGKPISLIPQAINDSKFLVIIKKDKINRMNTPITIGVYGKDGLISKINTSFLGPVDNEVEVHK
ncbi:MAG: cytochrome c oxidase accessory protein CcoG [Ignavibacteriaceae bacterium]